MEGEAEIKRGEVMSKAVMFMFQFVGRELETFDECLGLEVHFRDGSVGKIGQHKFEKLLRKYCKKHGVILPPKGVR